MKAVRFSSHRQSSPLLDIANHRFQLPTPITSLSGLRLVLACSLFSLAFIANACIGRRPWLSRIAGLGFRPIALASLPKALTQKEKTRCGRRSCCWRKAERFDAGKQIRWLLAALLG